MPIDPTAQMAAPAAHPFQPPVVPRRHDRPRPEETDTSDNTLDQAGGIDRHGLILGHTAQGKIKGDCHQGGRANGDQDVNSGTQRLALDLTIKPDDQSACAGKQDAEYELIEIDHYRKLTPQIVVISFL